ncbi:hypothetical protein G7Y79_00014g037350 [Physcia stellaris]|nr:hypothetical protein G7Y79_00014g037350 [Physcia stellaris]
MSEASGASAQGPYIPTDRADVDKTAKKRRDRKFDDKEKIRKKNSVGLYVFVVSVVSATWNEAESRWDYILDDHEGKRIEGTTKETDLQ